MEITPQCAGEGADAPSLRDSRAAALDHDRPLTRNERVVLRQLQKASRPIKAYQLLEDLKDDGLRAPMTIYRALDSLIRRKLARKIASANAFVATSPDTATEPGAYFICRSCGQVSERSLRVGDVEALFAEAGVRIDQFFLEAYGDCLGCTQP